MDRLLKPSLTLLVRIEHRGAKDLYGGTAHTTIGPLLARFEQSRARIATVNGETVTSEGMLFFDSDDFLPTQVEAGDTVVEVETNRRRVIRLIELLRDIDGNPDHYEVSL